MPRALGRWQGATWAAHRPGQPQVAMAARMAAVHRHAHCRGRGRASATLGSVSITRKGFPHRELRAGVARPRAYAYVAAQPRGSGRGPTDQELGDEDGGVREETAAALSPGVDGNSDGKPSGRTGFTARLGRRLRFGTEVAADSMALDVRGRRQGSQRGAAPRHPAPAPVRLHGTPHSQ